MALQCDPRAMFFPDNSIKNARLAKIADTSSALALAAPFGTTATYGRLVLASPDVVASTGITTRYSAYFPWREHTPSIQLYPEHLEVLPMNPDLVISRSIGYSVHEDNAPDNDFPVTVPVTRAMEYQGDYFRAGERFMLQSFDPRLLRLSLISHNSGKQYDIRAGKLLACFYWLAENEIFQVHDDPHGVPKFIVLHPCEIPTPLKPIESVTDSIFPDIFLET